MPDPLETAQAFERYGVAYVLLAIAIFGIVVLLRIVYKLLTSARDEAIAGWQSQTAATAKLADELAEERKRLVADIRHELEESRRILIEVNDARKERRP